MDAEIETLRKVDALTRSPNKGEAQAARSRLASLLQKRSKTEADLQSILNPPKPVDPPPSPLGNIFGSGFDDYMEKQEPGYKARMAAEQAAKKKEAAAYRKAVIGKYGSEDAAKAPNAMERAVDEAVAPFARKVMHKFSNGTFPCNSLDGWTGDFDKKELPKRLEAAIRAALPLPTTIAEAKAEADAWRERDDELAAIWEEPGYRGEHLSLGCDARKRLVNDMVDHGLRAGSAADMLARLHALLDMEMTLGRKDFAPLLADLEHLAAMKKASVQPAPVVKRQKQTARKANPAQTDFEF
jgi:hypothetical protein